MYYLPADYINSNWSYSFNGDYYTIKTNNNCHTQFQTTYCDCYSIFPDNDYLVSNSYSCSNTNSSLLINADKFTDNYFYRLDFVNIVIIFFIMFLFLIYMPYKIYARMFGRWLKV